MYFNMGYGLSRTVVPFSTGPLWKKLLPLEVDMLASLILWFTFGFVSSIFAVVGFVLIFKYIFHKYISVLKQILCSSLGCFTIDSVDSSTTDTTVELVHLLKVLQTPNLLMWLRVYMYSPTLAIDHWFTCWIWVNILIEECLVNKYYNSFRFFSIKALIGKG